MRKSKCELIRHELDELMLDEQWSSAATEHLRGCAECRLFQEQQTKLRRIVGSLGTVEAPADFDFRLRARLANQSSSMTYFYGPLIRRGLATAAMVIVFGTGALLVRNIINRPARVEEVAQQPKAVEPDQPRVVKGGNESAAPVAGIPGESALIVRKPVRPVQVGFKKRPMGVIESSFLGAGVLNGAQPAGMSAAFPIDASSQSFKVSVDDGRGNARTIFVPTISFGSQRIVQNANQFAPKRVW